MTPIQVQGLLDVVGEPELPPWIPERANHHAATCGVYGARGESWFHAHPFVEGGSLVATSGVIGNDPTVLSRRTPRRSRYARWYSALRRFGM